MNNKINNTNDLVYLISSTRNEYKEIEKKILEYLKENVNDFEIIKVIVIKILDEYEIHHKNKIAKIINEINDIIEKSTNLQFLIELNIKISDWLKSKNIIFLLNKIKLKLVNLYFSSCQYKESLNLSGELILSAKEEDDKHLLVETYLLECKNYFTTKNYVKAKNSLIACKSNAHCIYVPPNLQANIDMVAGYIYCFEKDFKTGYSYFYESFDIFNQLQNTENAQKCFNYMILCKIMQNKENELKSLLNGRYGIKYANQDESKLIINISIANFSNKLIDFTRIIKDNEEKINSDLILKSHINNLYDNLFENNIFDLIQSYSKIQIDYLSQKLGVSYIECQNKLAELIIDNKLKGTLDQGNGQLIIFEEEEENENYEKYNNTLNNMDKIVELWIQKSKVLKVN